MIKICAKLMVHVAGWIAFLALLAGTSVHAQDHYFKTTAKYALIMDYETGQILYSKRGDEQMLPASMSKLMTAAIVLEKLKAGELTPEAQFEISEKAWRTGGSKMFVLVNTTISVRDLLTGIIVVSGNDACIAIAENISGSEEAFVELMNQKAKEWGLTESSFANPTGLPDPKQLMSPKDLAKLTHKIIIDYPDYFHIFQTPEFTWSKITQGNRNSLLTSFDGADGMKTGHTDASGFGLVGTAFQDQQRRIIVINGLESASARTREANRMMDLAFSQFDTRQYFYAGDKIGDADVFMGTEETVGLVINNDVRYTMHSGSLDSASAKIIYNSPLRAPLKEGTQVAVLKIDIPGKGVQEYPLYTDRSVYEIGFMGKVKSGLAAMLTPPSAEDIK